MLLKEGGDSRTVTFVGKVENPWSETRTKHVPELLVLKTEVIIIFLDMHVPSTNASRQLNHFLRWTSFEERLPNEDDHILLISFVYHCQSFLISHEQSVKEGLFVALSFLSRAHSMPVPLRIRGVHIIHAIQG